MFNIYKADPKFFGRDGDKFGICSVKHNMLNIYLLSLWVKVPLFSLSLYVS